MRPRQRREHDGAELREAILDAARELFVELGYERVSMRRIASRIEYSPTAIYLHFADKESLFRELCEVDYRSFSSHFVALGAIADAVERLQALGQAYVDFAASHPFHYQMMFMTPAPESRGNRAFEAEVKGRPEADAYAFLRRSVQEAIALGVLRPELADPELASQTLWAAMHGVASLEIAMRADDWVPWRGLRERTRAMLQAVMRGMLRQER